MKNNVMKILLSILLILAGIAAIATCSYFIAVLKDDVSVNSFWLTELANKQDTRFWVAFGYIVGIISGIGVFGMGSLIIANILYMFTTNKVIKKQNELEKKGA